MEIKKKPFLRIGQALDIAQGISILLTIALIAIGGYLLYKG